jgi:high-affinity iron transporter
MIQSFIIMFRETLEAALIVGIVLGYLDKSGQRARAPAVYLGIFAGAAASVLAAAAFSRWSGGFTGRREAVFEALTMLAGAVLLTGLIFWMMRQANRAAAIERQVEKQLAAGGGLFLLVFVSILREGVESVIFLSAAGAGGGRSLLGGLAGLGAALAVGAGLFFGLVRIRLRRFFAVTNVLLILFAAGLVAHGLHELQEAGLLPFLAQQAYDINPPLSAAGGYPLLHEKGHLGSIAGGLFGYNGNPSLLELAGYLLYLGAAAALWLKLSRKRAPAGPGSAA